MGAGMLGSPGKNRILLWSGERMSEAVKVTVRPNGPLRVEGAIVLCDAEGKEWDLTGKPAVSLCRCGASEKRPFCDGSHNKIGFQCAATPPVAP
jgi:CDGSH-type Zn-finger protein